MGYGQNDLKDIFHLKLPWLFEYNNYGCEAVGRKHHYEYTISRVIDENRMPFSLNNVTKQRTDSLKPYFTMWYFLTKLQFSAVIERKQTDSQKAEIISWIASECENIKLTLWKLWSVSCSAINESLALTGRNWISTWWETSSIVRNTVSPLILFFYFSFPFPLFFSG